LHETTWRDTTASVTSFGKTALDPTMMEQTLMWHINGKTSNASNVQKESSAILLSDMRAFTDTPPHS